MIENGADSHGRYRRSIQAAAATQATIAGAERSPPVMESPAARGATPAPAPVAAGVVSRTICAGDSTAVGVGTPS